MTRQEKHLWYDFLCHLKPQILRQRPIGRYIVDFYCHAAKLAIELDGSQHYEPESVEYDKIRTEYINSLGIEVLRFDNSEIDANFADVCDKIRRAVGVNPPPSADGTPFCERGQGVSPRGDCEWIARSDTSKERIEGFRLINHEINNVPVFDGLYNAYREFTAGQVLSPLKDRLFYFKCAVSYLDEPDRYFGVFERETKNNVEKFCYVFYKKFENNYYIDDIIVKQDFKVTAELLTDYILSLGDDTGLEINILPEDCKDDKLAMILALDKQVEDLVGNLKSPVYLNMYMNI